ncbi:MAG: hypothetical protein KC619_14270 [Myxococcales bacterium]|nr:hypothetical protein [Myxococcales bacterium]
MSERARVGRTLVRLLRRRGGGRRGHGAAEEAVAWAQSALEAGLTNRAVCILAAASPPYYSSEIDELFSTVLDALGLPEPEPIDALHDSSLLVICRAVLAGELAVGQALDDIAWILEDAGWPDRHAAWIALVEAGSLMALGEAQVFVPTLSAVSLGEHVRRAARETLSQFREPSWLPAYLSLDFD